ncbi:hypothetical protein [uncultured Chryseobacterium sp.]|uniref:hypothetical protein n=1 Tax=uncultured Chryseobacterium sp. TaxID=259322 RepID=UPI0025CEE774|nr:hypothetical protein [uncultured Chryseobacterium sp.]
MEDKVLITIHAYERARERYRWKKVTLIKMAQIAFKEGVKYSDTKGELKKFINKVQQNNQKVNNIRLYGQDIYFFDDNVLITLYQLPNTLKKYMRIFKPKN